MWSPLIDLAMTSNVLSYRSLDSFFTLFVVIALYRWIRQKENFFDLSYTNVGSLNKLVLAFLIATSISYLVNSITFANAISDIFDLRWILSLYASIYAGHKLRENKEWKLWSPIFSVTLSILLCLYAFHQNRDLLSAERRLQMYYENPNHLALALLSPWALYLAHFALKGKTFKWPTIAVSAGLAAISLSILFTYSRSAWMGMCAAAIIAILYTRQKFLIRWIALAIVALMLVYSTNSFDFKTRLNYSFDFSKYSSQTSRLVAWEAYGRMFLEYPMFGVGLENSHKFHQKYYEAMNTPTILRAGHAHNQFLQILAGTGIFGFISYYLIFFTGYIFFHRKYVHSHDVGDKKTALAGMLIIVAMLFSSITDTPFRIPEGRNYLLLLLGICFGYLNYQEKQRTQKIDL